MFEQPDDVPGKRPGVIDVALEYLQDSDGEELSLEEVLARARGILSGKDWGRQDPRNQTRLPRRHYLSLIPKSMSSPCFRSLFQSQVGE